MTIRGRGVVVVLCSALLAINHAQTSAVQQAAPNRENFACGLFPIEDIEALYGAKAATPPNGYYGAGVSTCTLSISGGFVRVMAAAPGASAVESTVHEQLAALQSRITSTKNPPLVEAKDYGDVGCLGITFTAGPDGRAYDKLIHEALCLQLAGGYLVVHLASQNSSVLTDDHVKRLLAKAAERRK
ncbi:MAG TPA: hypothetical protein VKE94_23375 [Gemmataceae bacterium]|nr:hypothetical protein [Gemmataceae bacterium]